MGILDNFPLTLSKFYSGPGPMPAIFTEVIRIKPKKNTSIIHYKESITESKNSIDVKKRLYLARNYKFDIAF